MLRGRRFETARASIALVTLNAYLAALAPHSARAAEEHGPAETATEPASPSPAPRVAAEAEQSEPPAVAASSVSEAPETVTPMLSASAGTGSEVSSTALALPQGAATVGGMGESFSALLSTGTATYSVPIPLLPARGLAQPKLALSYTSGVGDGVAGMGWSVGVPFVSRDTTQGTPRYVTVDGVGGDRFVYNGTELVEICVVAAGLTCSGALSGEIMPAWSAGWRYFRSRVESGFQRLFWSPDGRTWRLQDRSGASAEFGAPLDSSGDTSALETAPRDTTRIFRWNISRQYDANGADNVAGDARPAPNNLVAYRYLADGGLAYLSDIYDTPPAASPSTAALSTFAHHTHLTWPARPDPISTYRRGWLTTQGRRLGGVDITSMPFAGGTTRQLVRRLHLAYDPGRHVSFLASIQEEGRCSGSESTGVPAEQSDGTLPATSCGLLPPFSFGYTHVVAANGSVPPSSLAGYEGFDSTVHPISNGPSHTVGDGWTSFFDANGDALPDVLCTDATTSQAPGSHLLFLNSAGGTKDHYGAGEPMTLALGTVPGIYSLNFQQNASLAPIDFDGNGVVDLVYMPQGSAPVVFAPDVTATGASWARTVPPVAAAMYPQLNLSNQNPAVRVADVNGDGAIDFVVSADDRIQTYFSLSTWRGGAGAFGTATVGTSGVKLSASPMATCVPSASTPVTFNDPSTSFADMNGDGLIDLVRVRSTDIRYWPGHGDGRWGVGTLAGCTAGVALGGIEVAMANAPTLSSVAGIELADVNGDGLPDLVQLEADGIYVWVNVDAGAFTTRVFVRPATTETTALRMRLVDIDGNGTSDIVWADARNYRYADLLGTTRPGLLTHIDNGYGKTTDITYGTTTSEMLAAAQAGHPWASTIPLVVPIVKSVAVSDHLDAVGRTVGTVTTQYTYRDPVYDGRRRDFRGFRDAIGTALGDANDPTSVTETHFLTGDCVDEDDSGRCGANARALDNLRDALKGLPTLVEVRDANGVVASTSHTTYRLRQLYASVDGREVRHAFPSVVTSYRYDTGAPASNSLSVSDVELEAMLGTVTDDPPVQVTLAGRAGVAQTTASMEVDRFGNTLATVDSGCVSGCAAADEVITDASVPRLLSDGSGWNWRNVESWVSGSNAPSSQRSHVYVSYDSFGRAVRTTASLVGSLPLVRSSAVAGAAVAPAPPTASADGTIELSTAQYDSFGNVTSTTMAGASCASSTYDPTYAELPVVATTFAGAASSGSCGGVQLVTTAEYDRGLRAETGRTGPNGEAGRADYDQFGRVVHTYAPDPSNLGQVVGAPTMTYEYLVTSSPSTQPWSAVHTAPQAGSTTASTTVQDRWEFFDGLGRRLMRLEQADPTAGDGGQWLVQGFVDFDAKARPLHSYRSWFWTGSPSRPPTSAPTTAAWQTQDAFGRPVDSYAVDGSHVGHVVYHALSQDAWDAAHLSTAQPSPFYTTITHDGHGREISAVQRFSSGATLDSRMVQVTYLPTGEPTVITRTHGTGTDAPVVRWMQYDSLGRRVLNVEPDSTVGFSANPTTNPAALKTWRYAYDNAGRLVGSSDARGCGENSFYDAAGRIVAEDYSPCTADQPAYTVPNLTTGDGTEAFYLYDAADPDQAAVTAAGCPASETPRGRLASVSSRGAKDVTTFDARGRATCSARKLAVPGAASPALAKRYAPRWYVQSTSYDGADRIVKSTTGARSPELLVNGASAVSMTYAASGAPYAIGSSYGPLIASITHDADGGLLSVVYGDIAGTTTHRTYDARHRLAAAYTARSAPALWTSPTAGYTPPAASAFTQPLVLENAAFSYNAASDPVEIQDLRAPAEWPAGAQPVSRAITYDGLYRVTDVKYSYPAATDAWMSPFAAEDDGAVAVEGGARPAPHVSFDGRVLEESFAFDWKGNTVSTSDDASGFYDRSLGTITNGTSGAGPYQLHAATNRGLTGTTTRAGDLAASYDEAGELTALVVHRDGACLPQGASCWQRFAYAWDEVGNIIDAQRWDLRGAERTNASALDQAPPARTPDIDLAYLYGSGGRVLKSATDAAGKQAHTAYIFSSLELKRTTFDFAAGDYVLDATTETPYLAGLQGPVARVVYAPADAPTATSGRLHVFLELPDQLGSTTTAIDRDTSELVERATYGAFGGAESDYRPDRWDDFREENRFTGKEDDIEVGLQYFGARYYSAYLGRWASPDPLALHSPGAEDDNVYAYGHGRVFSDTDPDGRVALVDDLLWGILIGGAIGAASNAAAQAWYIATTPGATWNDFDGGAVAKAALSGAVTAAAVVLGGAALAPVIGEGGLAGLAARGYVTANGSAAGFATSYELTPPSQRGDLLREGLTQVLIAVALDIIFRGALKAGTKAGGRPASSAGAGAGDSAASSASAEAPAPGGAGMSGETVTPSAFPANDNGYAHSTIVDTTPQNDNGIVQGANDNNGITPEAGKRLNVQWQNAIDQVNVEGITRAQAAQEPGLRSAAQGTQLDTAFKAGVDADPTLKASGYTTTPRGVPGPDVKGPPGSGVSWDATTIKDYPNHLADYGPKLRPVLWFELKF